MKFLVLVLCLFISMFVDHSEAGCGIPGGLCESPISAVQEYLPEIEKTYNAKSKTASYGRVAKITSAKSQVVAGTRYVVKFTLSETDCSKEEISKGLKTTANCKHVKHVEDCVADVIVRLWQNYKEVSEMKCNDVVTDYYKSAN